MDVLAVSTPRNIEIPPRGQEKLDCGSLTVLKNRGWLRLRTYWTHVSMVKFVSQ